MCFSSPSSLIASTEVGSICGRSECFISSFDSDFSSSSGLEEDTGALSTVLGGFSSA